MYRPENWKEHIEYFNGRPKGMTEIELWEFGANSMLKALREMGEDVYTPQGTGKLVIIPDDTESASKTPSTGPIYVDEISDKEFDPSKYKRLLKRLLAEEKKHPGTIKMTLLNGRI